MRSLAPCLVMMLAGCATSGNEPLDRSLPAKPGYARPVIVSEPAEGENSIARAGRERAGRLANARRLNDFANWYDALKARFEAKPK